MITSTTIDARTEVALSPFASDAVLVHIGPYKTGTTAIQSVLADSRDELTQRGVLYPGTRRGHRAAKALRQFGNGWQHDAETPPDPAAWDELAQAVRAHHGRVVVSSEVLSEADASARSRLVDDFGSERLQLVVAARNSAMIAASTWQQVVRTYGDTLPLDEWLEISFRRAGPTEPPNRFWRRSDPVNLIDEWTDVVPRDRITVVVIDDRDHRLLPTAFEQLLDLPAGLLADRRPRRNNRGLTATEATLIRQVNTALKTQLSWADYNVLMRTGVIERLLQVRTPGPDEGKERLPDWAIEQSVHQAEWTIAGLLASGVRIVGDLDSLRRPAERPAPAAPVTDVPLDLAAEAVVGAIAAATRGSWSLETAPRDPDPDGDLGSVSSRDLARTLARRVRGRVRRAVTRKR